METLSTEPEIQDGLGFKSSIPRWGWKWWTHRTNCTTDERALRGNRPTTTKGRHRGKRDSSMHTMGRWYSNDFSCIPLNAVTHMKTCKISSSMKRWRNCRNMTQQGMRWERPQPPVKPLTDKTSWSEESLQVTYRVNAVYFFQERRLSRHGHTESSWHCVCSSSCHFEEFQFCIWSFKMADNCRDLYSRNCMMQSMTTTTSSSRDDQTTKMGQSTWQKPTYLRLLIHRFLPIVNMLTQPLANRKQPRRQHQHWAECQKRKHHHQHHGEPSKPLLRQNKLQ